MIAAENFILESYNLFDVKTLWMNLWNRGLETEIIRYAVDDSYPVMRSPLVVQAGGRVRLSVTQAIGDYVPFRPGEHKIKIWTNKGSFVFKVHIP